MFWSGQSSFLVYWNWLLGIERLRVAAKAFADHQYRSWGSGGMPSGWGIKVLSRSQEFKSFSQVIYGIPESFHISFLFCSLMVLLVVRLASPTVMYRHIQSWDDNWKWNEMEAVEFAKIQSSIENLWSPIRFIFKIHNNLRKSARMMIGRLLSLGTFPQPRLAEWVFGMRNLGGKLFADGVVFFVPKHRNATVFPSNSCAARGASCGCCSDRHSRWAAGLDPCLKIS